MKLKVKNMLIVFVAVILILVSLNSCDSTKDDPWTNFDGSAIVCRHQGCGKKPVYSDWNRRYCSLHIKGEHYCRYPGCSNRISNSSTSRYCSEHD